MSGRRLLLGLESGLAAGYAMARTFEALREWRDRSPVAGEGRRCLHASAARVRSRRHAALDHRILRICLRAACAAPRQCDASRSGVASPGFVLRAALARRRDHRAADVVPSRIYARAAFRLDRSDSARVARRVREERAVKRGANRLPCDAARLCGVARAAAVAVARKPRNTPALRRRKHHRSALRAAAL